MSSKQQPNTRPPFPVLQSKGHLSFAPLGNTPLWCLDTGVAQDGTGNTIAIVAIVGGSGSQESKTGVGEDQLAICSVAPSTGAIELRASVELSFFPDSVFLSPDCRFVLVTSFHTCALFDIAGSSLSFDSIVECNCSVCIVLCSIFFTR